MFKLMANLKKLIDEYDKQKKLRLFNDGYEWASNLLNTYDGAQKPSDMCDENLNEFDRGVFQAEFDYTNGLTTSPSRNQNGNNSRARRKRQQENYLQ